MVSHISERLEISAMYQDKRSNFNQAVLHSLGCSPGVERCKMLTLRGDWRSGNCCTVATSPNLRRTHLLPKCQECCLNTPKSCSHAQRTLYLSQTNADARNATVRVDSSAPLRLFRSRFSPVKFNELHAAGNVPVRNSTLPLI